MSSVGAQWPTNTLTLAFPMIWSAAEAPMAVTAAQSSVSDGNFAVCASMDFAIWPSVCSGRTADAIVMRSLLRLCRDERPDVVVRRRLLLRLRSKLRASGCGSDHVVFMSGTCRGHD